MRSIHMRRFKTHGALTTGQYTVKKSRKTAWNARQVVENEIVVLISALFDEYLFEDKIKCYHNIQNSQIIYIFW